MAAKKNDNFKFYFNDGLKYIRESKAYIFAIIAIFLFFTAFAFFNASLFNFIDEYLKDLIGKTEGLNALQITIFILDNNLKSAVIGYISGILFGIPPLFHTILNGSVLGYVYSKVYLVSGFADFWRILPHGIFELPAIFISLGLGIKLGTSFFTANIMKSLRERFIRGGRAFVLIVIPLLVIAAIIEGILISYLNV